MATKAAMGFGEDDDDVETPDELYDILDKEFNFDYDPCPLKADFDSLSEWAEWGATNFVNPPFSNIPAFLEKAVNESAKGKTSVFLIPARVNTVYWGKYVYPYAEQVRILETGLKFKGYDRKSPFAVAVVVIPGYCQMMPRFREVSDGTYKWFITR